jgi:heme A synthase
MQSLPSSRRFITLALITAVLTVALIVIGAVVRVTDSGLGCGNQWPTCNGSLFPPLSDINAWIEWSHRLVAMLIGVFGIAMLVVAVRNYRKQNTLVLKATILAACLYAFQSMLGAIVVKLDLQQTSVTIHLATAMLLFASLLLAALSAAYQNPHPRRNITTVALPSPSGRGGETSRRFTLMAYFTALLALLVIIIGGIVRGNEGTMACGLDWPLCNGQLLPFGQGPLQALHLTHRVVVVLLGVSLIALVLMARSARQDQRIRRLALAALAAYLVQAAIGALVVVTVAQPVWRAGHVLFAALTWAALVSLSIIETFNNREVRAGQAGTWQQPSEAPAN